MGFRLEQSQTPKRIRTITGELIVDRRGDAGREERMRRGQATEAVGVDCGNLARVGRRRSFRTRHAGPAGPQQRRFRAEGKGTHSQHSYCLDMNSTLPRLGSKTRFP